MRKHNSYIVCGFPYQCVYFQMMMIKVGLENLVIPSDDVIANGPSLINSESVNVQNEKKWRAGELEFEAEMRTLDNAVSVYCFP